MMPSRIRSVYSIKGAEVVGMSSLTNGITNQQNGSSTMSKPVTPHPPEDVLPAPVQQGADSERKHKKTARIGGGLRVHWVSLRKRIGTATAPSTSESMIGDSSAAGSSNTHSRPPDDESEEVDEIVVDRTWSEEIKSSVAQSEVGAAASPEKSNSHQPADNSLDHDSLEHYEGFWASSSPLVFLRWRLWPMVTEFFTGKLFDEKAEDHYRNENWFVRKVWK